MPPQHFHPVGSVCHTTGHDSLLSQPASKKDVWGLTNLLVLIFVATNCREIVANILKYGILVRVIPSRSFVAENAVTLFAFAIMVANAHLGYVLEIKRGAIFKTSMKLLEPEEADNVTAAKALQGTATAVQAEGDEKEGKPGEEAASEGGGEEAASEEGGEEAASEGGGEEAASEGGGEEAASEGGGEEAASEGGGEEAELTKQEERTEKSGGKGTGLKGPLIDRVAELLGNQRKLQEAAEHLHVLLVTICSVCILVVPYLLLSFTAVEPGAALLVLFVSVTWLLKLVSFHHILHDIRMITLKGETLSDICPSPEEQAAIENYPDILTARSFWLYMAYPTLCFQLQYPLSNSICWTVVGRSIAAIILCVIAMKILIEQYMTVIVLNTFTVISDGSEMSSWKLGLHLLERMLKLSLPTLYVWLLMFLCFFHFWLVLLAELTCFKDKRFYDDWWNAVGFGEYWRKWNLPVHNFCSRHVYKPLVKRGVSKLIASQAVFMISALAHEYLVVAPLQIGWTGLVFTAFILQTPLAIITDWTVSRSSRALGNMIFWLTFTFTGQPLAIMVFYYLWNVRKGSSFTYYRHQF